MTEPEDAATARNGGGRGAFLVGSGILASRIAGLVRQSALSHYLGLGHAADAWNVAFSAPNFLQTMFGEGVLSASFIPVYSRLLARGEREEAERVAGATLTLLAIVTSVLVLLGILAAPLLVDVLAPGYAEDKQALIVRLVRIFFPGAALLALSAWALGVLNSHRRFFLSYAAPVMWNLTIIAALVLFGGRESQSSLTVYAAWASVAGSALQLLVQLPAVLTLLRGLRLSLGASNPHVATVRRNFAPVFFSRGVVQISAWIDRIIGSFLGVGAVAALGNAQTLYTLPVSLFGMAVSASELPEMSRAAADPEELATRLRARLRAGVSRISFFIVASTVAFLLLGDVIIAALLQSGEFQRADTRYVWGILAAASVGLLASTRGRLYASAFYALHDTRTPVRFSLVRVAFSVAVGAVAALWLPGALGVSNRWGAAGLTLASAVAGWVEYLLLRNALRARIGVTGADPDAARHAMRVWASALAAAGLALTVRGLIASWHPKPLAVVVLGVYGVLYFAFAAVLGVAEARAVWARVGRLASRR